MSVLAVELVEWLKSWPATVWSTIGGSTITLVGVLFSDWRNTNRLSMQHRFTAQESDLARLAAVRKDVYLSAAGVLARLQEFLLCLPTANDDSSSQPMIEFAELVGKVSMVGESETVLIAQKLAADYTEVHSVLAMLARDARQARLDADRSKEYREKAALHVDRVATEIARFLEAGRAEELPFKAMLRSQAAFQKEVQDHWAEEDSARLRFSKELNSFIVRALEIIAPIGDSGARLLIAVRNELGQRTNSDELLVAVKEQRERAFSRLRQVVAEIESQRE